MHVPRLFELLGWNRWPLTFTDFEEACQQQEIQIIRPPMKTPGMYFHCEDQPFIALSSRLMGVRLWYTAFHELTHHLEHPPGLRCFTKGTVSKIEAQANIMAVCAVIDEPTLFGILNNGDLHDFPKDMMKFRMMVAQRFRM